MARTYLEDRVERLESVVEHALHLTHTLYAMLIASLPEHKREIRDLQRETRSKLRLIKKPASRPALNRQTQTTN